ncbi:hypothetical protein INR49_020743, partial [Caranx melampygus]
ARFFRTLRTFGCGSGFSSLTEMASREFHIIRLKQQQQQQQQKKKKKMADSTSSHSDSSSSPNSLSSSSFKELTHSVISVVSYLLLACLCVTITFRVYKSVIQAIQKSDEGHPFRSLLERDISVSSETVRQLADHSLIHLNWFSSQTRRLLLVEDLVDSLKLAAVMWVMTYVGAVFNGVTILILGENSFPLVLFLCLSLTLTNEIIFAADIIFFTTPLVYQKNKTKIDQNINMVRCRLEETLYKTGYQGL